MKIHSISLKNFRGVNDATVEFGDGVTIVEGPNEAGKSSLVEALTLLRNWKASSKAQRIKDLKPTNRDVGPEAEVCLTIGDQRLRYRKRWLRETMTTLEIEGTARQSYTGDAAHDHYFAILSAGVDINLLDALELSQGASLDQPDLRKITVLRSRLGGTELDQTHDVVMEAVEEEYKRYLTESGKPRDEYLRAIEAVPPLEMKFNEMEAESAQIDDLTQEHSRLLHGLAAAEANFQAASLELDTQLRAESELATLRRAAEQAATLVTQHQQQLAAAQVVAADRHRMIDDVERRREALTEHTRRRDDALEQYRRVTEANDGPHPDETSIRLQLEQARTLVKQTRERLTLAQLSQDFDLCRARLERAEAAEDRRAAAEAIVEATPVTAAEAERLSELETELRIAQGALEAAAATITVESLGDHTIALPESQVAPGDTTELSVTQTVTIHVDQVLHVEVRPAAAPADLQTQVDSLAEQLRQALAEISAESVTEAKQLAAHRSEAEKARAAASTELEAILDGGSLSELRTRTQTLQARLEGRSVPQSSIAELSEAVQAAEAAEHKANQAATDERIRIEQTQQQRDKQRETLVRQEQAVVTAAEEHQAAVAQLARARDLASDEAVEQDVAEATEKLDQAKRNAESQQAHLEASRPDQVAMELANARALVERFAGTQKQLTAELNRISGVLEDRSGRGVYDALVQTRSELELARQRLTSIQRSARAVELLRSTLKRHQAQAQQRYVAPFRKEIERLGRLVFGSSFGIEVSTDLAVTHRTLDGVTVPFDLLSTGAKEQVALLCRMATARLVEPEHGAPLILDDTLGFADPQRLRALGAVFTHVGEAAQIIILTCQPERYRTLGAAEVVRLASRSEPAPAAHQVS